MSTACLSDIAWVLVRPEKREEWLVAEHFAAIGAPERADILVRRISEAEKIKKQSAAANIAGHTLAYQVVAGNTAAIAAATDQQVIARAAHRTLGYIDERGQRIKLGFGQGNSLLSAPPEMNQRLLARWDELIRTGAAYGPLPSEYGRVGLAESWFLAGDTSRAGAALDGIELKSKRCDRSLVALLLRFGEPERALASAKSDEHGKSRAMCELDVAGWLYGKGRTHEAIRVARTAADELASAKDYRRLAQVIELLVALNQVDLAREYAVQSEEAGWKEFMAVFNMSTVGGMFGVIGDLDRCQRLQARALGLSVPEGEKVDWSKLRHRATWEGGVFDLGKALTNEVAAQRIGCGDRTGLADIDNRTLALHYCSLYKRGYVKPADLQGRRPMHDDDFAESDLVNNAAECHFELGERDMALSLLAQLREEAVRSMDYATAHAAAELSCVYSSQADCSSAIRVAGQALLKAVDERRLSAYTVLIFADNWRKWTGN
jgi:hypothetical protein